MKRALVIRCYGDPDLYGPMAKALQPVATDSELSEIKAEIRRLNAINGVRSYGDSVRLETACKALAVKYPQETHGRLYGAILGVWALLWLGIYGWVDYFTRWNRES